MAKLIPNGMPYLGRVGNTLAKPTQKGYISVQQYDPQLYNPTSTEAQMAVRARFRELTKIAHAVPIECYAGISKKAYAKNMSVRNLFVQHNWEHVTATPGVTGQTETKWADLKFVWGSIDPVMFASPSFSTPLTITVPFNNTSGVTWPNDAHVAIFAICPEANEALLSGDVAASLTSISLSVPAHWNGRRVFVYGFTVTGDTPIDAETNIEGATYQGGLIATQWHAILTETGKAVMSNTVFVGVGTIS